MTQYQITFFDSYHNCHRKVTIDANSEKEALTRFHFDYDVGIETTLISIDQIVKE